MRRTISGVLASGLLALFSNAYANELGSHIRRTIDIPASERTAGIPCATNAGRLNQTRQRLIDSATGALMNLSRTEYFRANTFMTTPWSNTSIASHRSTVHAIEPVNSPRLTQRLERAAIRSIDQFGPIMREVINTLYLDLTHTDFKPRSAWATRLFFLNAGEKLRRDLYTIVASTTPRIVHIERFDGLLTTTDATVSTQQLYDFITRKTLRAIEASMAVQEIRLRDNTIFKPSEPAERYQLI